MWLDVINWHIQDIMGRETLDNRNGHDGSYKVAKLYLWTLSYRERNNPEVQTDVTDKNCETFRGLDWQTEGIIELEGPRWNDEECGTVITRADCTALIEHSIEHFKKTGMARWENCYKFQCKPVLCLSVSPPVIKWKVDLLQSTHPVGTCRWHCAQTIEQSAVKNSTNTINVLDHATNFNRWKIFVHFKTNYCSLFWLEGNTHDRWYGYTNPTQQLVKRSLRKLGKLN